MAARATRGYTTTVPYTSECLSFPPSQPGRKLTRKKSLGVRHALETTECNGVPLRVRPFELPTSGNPYFLPWSLRGMLEEAVVREQLADESVQLLELFEKWKPTTKTLKDVKFRLEGIRSRL